MMTIIIIIVTIKRRTNRFRERIRNPRSYLPLPLPLPLPNFLLFGYRERETRRTIATLGARHFYLFRIFHRRSKFISSSHKLQSLGRLASDRRLSACFVGENAAGLNGGRNVDGICRERAERGEGVMFLKDCTKGERRKNGGKKKKRARRRRKAALDGKPSEVEERRLYTRDRVLLSSLRRSPSFPEMRPHERIFDPF